MKILVVSDTHKHIQPMLDITADEKPDVVIHLGDCIADARELERVYPHMTVYSVPGNNDFDFRTLPDKEIKINGKKLYITHGHIYSVKSRLSLLKAAAVARSADIVLFGHTHVPLHEFDGRLHMLNPGALYRPARGKKTYAVINLDDDIKIEIKEYLQ